MAATDPPEPPQQGGFARAWTILHFRGVPIRVHLSWVLIAGLVLWVFWIRFNQLLLPYTTTAVVASAAVLALCFFASILAHELGHAVTSLDRGIPVLGITLFLLGGVTESTREAERPRDELVIVGSGPFISVVLAGLFGLAHAIAPGTTPYGAVTGYAAWVNLALAIFNVLPAYPLDGGRLLRAVLWAVTGTPHRATRWAARIGQVFAAVLLLGGLNGLLGGPIPQVDGPFRWIVVLLAANGLWGLLVGFFLLRGAVDAHRRARARETLAQHTAGDVMGGVPPALAADLSLSAAVEHLQERPSVLWPVGVPMVGAVRLADLDRVTRDAGPNRSLGDVVLPTETVTVDAGTPLDVALDRMLDAPGQMLVVTREGRPVGLLSPSLVGGLLA